MSARADAGASPLWYDPPEFSGQSAIDPLRKRFTFPTVRAYLLGVVQIPVFLFWPFKDFTAWYTELQEKMYGNR
jgi:hypothetical protein